MHMSCIAGCVCLCVFLSVCVIDSPYNNECLYIPSQLPLPGDDQTGNDDFQSWEADVYFIAKGSRLTKIIQSNLTN